jgi:hypothetical protein
MHGGGFLCSRCGSPKHEIVGEGEMRCSECGLGSSFSSIASFRRTPTPDDRADLERWQRMQRQHAFAEIARAPFRAHGLDTRWNGLRWLGGWGTSSGLVTNIQLAHSNSVGDAAATQIRVDTRAANSQVELDVAWYAMAQHHVGELWRRTGGLSENLRRAAFPTTPPVGDPTAPWQEVVLPLDAEAVAFRMLASGDFWVAQARLRDAVVGIEAVRWPLEQTGIVSIQDLTDYEVGSREIVSRWT